MRDGVNRSTADGADDGGGPGVLWLEDDFSAKRLCFEYFGLATAGSVGPDLVAICSLDNSALVSASQRLS
jgi:hypothetical protein